MHLRKTKTLSVSYFASNLAVVVGLVMIWRGVWYILDEIDYIVFGNEHWLTALGGIIVGLLILYIPDKDLKEIGKL